MPKKNYDDSNTLEYAWSVRNFVTGKRYWYETEQEVISQLARFPTNNFFESPEYIKLSAGGKEVLGQPMQNKSKKNGGRIYSLACSGCGKRGFIWKRQVSGFVESLINNNKGRYCEKCNLPEEKTIYPVFVVGRKWQFIPNAKSLERVEQAIEKDREKELRKQRRMTMYSKDELLDRGWTGMAIYRLLPKQQGIKAADVKLWDKTVIHEAEKTPEFKQYKKEKEAKENKMLKEKQERALAAQRAREERMRLRRSIKWIAKTTVLKRGWTEKIIKELLPAPKEVPNPHYKSAAPMLLWEESVVVAAEETEAFKAVKAKKEKRKATVRKTEAEKKQKYVEKFNRQYNCGWSDDDIRILVEQDNRSASDATLLKYIKESIPEHPKDEYPQARQLKRKFVIHSGTTNTGKTYTALQRLKTAKTGIYLGPLRLLALEVYHTLNDDGVPTTLSTGEEEIVTKGAMHYSSTIEKLDTSKKYDVVVIDEGQMLGDEQRGNAWLRAILGAVSKEVHVCCAPYGVDSIVSLINKCSDSYEIIEHERKTPLMFEEQRFSFPHDVQRGDALIAFSKRMVLSIASLLADRGIKASIIYGNLPPDARRKQTNMYINGETDIVVATDAIGMGLNLPIRRIIFMEYIKFDGTDRRELYDTEVHQIAGRAGRYNMYDVGYVNCYGNGRHIRSCLRKTPAKENEIYYTPSTDFVLSIPAGTLQDRIRTCMEIRASSGEFCQTDIQQLLELLETLEKNDSLQPSEKLGLAMIPFDAKSDDLLLQWTYSIDCYVAGKTVYIPGKPHNANLDALELYYSELDLHYSFNRTLKLPFDAEQVLKLKNQTSDEINRILIERIKKMGRKCRSCGSKLDWNSPYGLCEGCYEGRRYDWW